MDFLSGLFKNSKSKKYEQLYEEAKTFIQVHYVRERGSERYAFNTLSIKSDPEREACEEWYKSHGDPELFQDIVQLYLNENHIKSSTLCTEYNLESRVFSKNNSSFSVEKWEAVAVCFGLDLNISEARALLKRAGYALTNSSESDLVIRFCLENDIYELKDINYLLTKICDRTLEQI